MTERLAASQKGLSSMEIGVCSELVANYSELLGFFTLAIVSRWSNGPVIEVRYF
jgi:hypothetical protein